MALHLARTRTVAEVRRAIDRAAIVADPAGADAAVLAAKESEFLSFTPVPDGVEVRGFLSNETAAVVLTAFDQCHDAMFRRGRLAEDCTQDGRSRVRTPGWKRARREHRNAQIFGELLSRLLDDAELGSKHAQRPHMTVTVHADDYTAGLGGDLLLPGFGPVPVPNSTIDRLFCDAEVHPILTRRGQEPPARSAESSQFPGSVPRPTAPPWRPPWRPRPTGGWERVIEHAPDPTVEELEADTDLVAMTEFEDELDDFTSWWNRSVGERPRHVLDVGRSRRTAPPKIRRALTVRDGGCTAPGCDTDPSRCEAHHIDHWEFGGETSISNMVLLCSRHHHMVHEGRWQILRNDELEPGHPDHITLAAPMVGR
jgi:hypothetical protein